MMKPSHLAAQGADLVDRGLREVGDSLAAGVEPLGLGLYLLWLHLVLGALVLAKVVIIALKGDHPGRER